jgi:uncharacterized membrane protein SpoIIM required for sporulation
MSQRRFIDKHRGEWSDFEFYLDELEAGESIEESADIPAAYRRICQHLAIARNRGYRASLIQRLDQLVQRGHALLYQDRAGRWSDLLDFIRRDYPRQVRRDAGLLGIAACLLFGTMLATYIWLQYQPEWAYHILGPSRASGMEDMYAKGSSRTSPVRDIFMFGFYIYNNVGIALRTYGSGALWGIGAIFIEIYNGVVLGAAASHVQNADLGDNFWPFVIGHGAFELTAIALAGQAGLKIGFAPFWPGRRSRLDAFKHAASNSLGLVAGFTGMLVIAAFIEAFWSSSAVDPSIRYAVGSGLWITVLLYFWQGGRR